MFRFFLFVRSSILELHYIRYFAGSFQMDNRRHAESYRNKPVFVETKKRRVKARDADKNNFFVIFIFFEKKKKNWTLSTVEILRREEMENSSQKNKKISDERCGRKSIFITRFIIVLFFASIFEQTEFRIDFLLVPFFYC